MANGDDKPAFDPTQPFQSADVKPAFDPTKPFTPAQQVGGGQAALEGLKSGASAGWSDELTAGAGAFGLAEAAAYNPEFAKNVDEAGGLPKITAEMRADARAQREAAQAQHPYLYGGGEFVGGAASMAALPVGGALPRTATFAQRLGQGAKIGAGYGAITGAAQGQRDNGLPGAVIGAGIGAPVGGLVGAGGAGLVEGIGAGVRPFAQKVASAYRAAVDPEAEASRQLTQAGVQDIANIGKTWNPMTPEQVAAANTAGLPRAAVDVMGPNTRALAEWASSVSPDVEARLRQRTQELTQQQPRRVSQFIQDLTGGGDLNADQVAIEAGARAVNKPAYLKAYAAGDRPIWSPELERLTSSPDVAGALRGAVNRWKSFQVKDGFGGMNPPVKVTPDGQLQFLPGKGVMPYPNLQLWDYAQRNLSGMAAQASRSGNKTDAGLFGGLADQLKTELDRLVPEFGDARAGAHSFFGATNALEAGAKFVSPQTNFNMGLARAAQAKMSEDERNLFARGYATQLAERVKTSGTKFLDNPQTQERSSMALGPENARQIEALVRAEQIVKSANNLYGGSPTAKRLAMQAGMGIGFGSGDVAYDYLTKGHIDPSQLVASTLIGGMAGRGTNILNQRLAARIGEMLTSGSPDIYAKGIQLLTRTPRAFNALRQATIGGTEGAAPRFSLPTPAAADQNQQNVPGPIQAQQAGGRIQQHRAVGGKVASDSGHGTQVESRFDPKSIGAKQAKNNRWYLKDPNRPGKFLMVRVKKNVHHSRPH